MVGFPKKRDWIVLFLSWGIAASGLLFGAWVVADIMCGK